MRSTMAIAATLLLSLVLTGCGALVAETVPPTAPAPAAAAPTQPPVGPPGTREVAVAPTAVQLQSEPAPTTAAMPAPETTANTAPDASALAPLSAVEVVDEVWPAVVTVVSDISTGPFGEGGVQEQGRGTGFIIDEQGHIVTNEHVVAGSDRLEVIFSDGEKRDATLVGTDPMSDLAVVQVDGELPAIVSLGDSERLQVGQPVLAIGSPLGEFSGTVTDGIVSALNRDFPGETGLAEYNNLIQHNAAINPGNSGGPLFDLNGNVIGVNTLGIPVSPTGSPVQGLFFAIPSNSVKQVAEELIANGRVRYPFFGATPGEINPELAAQYDLPVEYGAFLIEVAPNQPAGRAGIEEGDIVTALGDYRITAQRGFSEALYMFSPGDTITVTFIRGNSEMQADVTLGERQN